jgi:hypothetical protein
MHTFLQRATDTTLDTLLAETAVQLFIEVLCRIVFHKLNLIKITEEPRIGVSHFTPALLLHHIKPW